MELESQSLNSSMNRHFIFNSLNSIQYYINMQDRKSANRYLTSFAKLIRKNLDSSQQNETSLKDELDRLELYLSLEQMRFQGRFDYEISISPDVNVEDITIPAMMLQPFLENSIWHGILPSEKHGELEVYISEMNQGVEIEIKDNGIGVETSKSLKAETENGHISQGMDITQNRIQLYKNMTGLNYEIKGPYEIKNGSPENILGTVVTIRIPNKFAVSNWWLVFWIWNNSGDFVHLPCNRLYVKRILYILSIVIISVAVSSCAKDELEAPSSSDANEQPSALIIDDLEEKGTKRSNSGISVQPNNFNGEEDGEILINDDGDEEDEERGPEKE